MVGSRDALAYGGYMVYAKETVEEMISSGLWEIQKEIKTEVDVSVRFEDEETESK